MALKDDTRPPTKLPATLLIPRTIEDLPMGAPEPPPLDTVVASLRRTKAVETFIESPPPQSPVEGEESESLPPLRALAGEGLDGGNEMIAKRTNAIPARSALAGGRDLWDITRREIRAPFSPDDAVREIAAFVRSYRVAHVTGDRYAGEWVPAASRATASATGRRSCRSRTSTEPFFRSSTPGASSCSTTTKTGAVDNLAEKIPRWTPMDTEERDAAASVA
jgi:hypothetical protein